MKARVKATGYVCEFQRLDSTTFLRKTDGKTFQGSELEFIEDEPDYWTRLEHQYAGMAMQGILANSAFDDVSVADIAITSIKMATSLIERLKGERK